MFRFLPRFHDIIIFIFDSYFSNLELLKVTFIFITSLSVSSMDQYEKVILKEK
jgi:hypothetical protein